MSRRAIAVARAKWRSSDAAAAFSQDVVFRPTVADEVREHALVVEIL